MSSSRASMVVILCAALASGACEREQPNYCDTAPDHNCRDPSSDAGTPGTGKGCSTAKGANGNPCSGATPVCGDDNACHACTEHVQCGTKVCLPDGSCAVDVDVAYVMGGGHGSSCKQEAPCGTLQSALGTKSPYVKIIGTMKNVGTTTIDGQVVTIFADKGIQLSGNGDGPILVVTGRADVQIYDLEITGAQKGSKGDGDGIQLRADMNDMSKLLSPNLVLVGVNIDNNTRNGINVTSGILTIKKSTISGNADGIFAADSIVTITQSSIFDNTNIGIEMPDGSPEMLITVTNNFIYHNVRGLVLMPKNGSKLEFNTIVNNAIMNNIAGGVSCTTTTGGFKAPDNIILQNSLQNSSKGGIPQISGNCNFENSLTTLNSDTDFASIFDVKVNPNNYHLTARAGQAIDSAQTCDVGVDYDGDPRPSGQGCDKGADELQGN